MERPWPSTAVYAHFEFIFIISCCWEVAALAPCAFPGYLGALGPNVASPACQRGWSTLHANFSLGTLSPWMDLSCRSFAALFAVFVGFVMPWPNVARHSFDPSSGTLSPRFDRSFFAGPPAFCAVSALCSSGTVCPASLCACDAFSWSIERFLGRTGCFHHGATLLGSTLLVGFSVEPLGL